MKRLSLRARVYTGFGVVAVVLAAQLGVALQGLRRIEALRAERAHSVERRLRAAEALERAVLYRAITFRNLLVASDDRRRHEYAAAVSASVEELRRLGALSTAGGERDRFDAVSERFAPYEAARDAVLSAARDAGPSAPILAAREVDLGRARERLLDAVRAYAADEVARAEQIKVEADAAQRGVRLALLASAALVVLVLLATAVLTHRGVRRPAAALVEAARSLEAGDFGAARALAAGASPTGDELEALAGAFGRMGLTLERREARLEAGSRVAAAVASSLALPRVAERALPDVARFCRAELAALYLEAPDGTLARVGGWCAEGTPERLARDGVVAQALASGRPVVVDGLPRATVFEVRLGLGAAPPRTVAAVPLAGDGDAGVLVLAALDALAPDALPFAEHAAGLLAVAARNAAAHARVETLAAELTDANGVLSAQNAELQRQGEALQAQSEELQAQSEELQAQAEELHAQSDEIQQQNEDLRASREGLQRRTAALEDVDRRKVEFLAQLGHELRNPLAAIASAAYLLEARPPGGRASPHVAVVSRQVRQLRRLVDDLLDVSRIDSGKVELRVETVELRRVVEGALDAVRPALEAKGHRVSVAVPDGLALRIDPARMQQVVSNLLHNAARYTPHGGEVSVEAVRGEGEVSLSVRDSGIGIGPDLLPRLFEPFTRGDHGEQHGLGLGLALVRRFVRLHAGEVEVASEGPGRGAVFTVRLPAEVAARRPGAPVASAPWAAADDPLRILVVDDNEDLAETMGEMLRSFGHEVEVAYDPEIALEQVVVSPPDVAVLDIGLPRMDGYALARAIRTALPDAPLLLVAATGYAQPEDRSRALEAGFDLHLAKPVDPQELRAVLARVSSERGRSGGEGAGPGGASAVTS